MIRLTPNGIFPIIYDERGDLIKDRPKTGYSIPGTIQGEGRLAGVPSLFIRLWGCNLSCRWRLPNGDDCSCDTPESISGRGNSLEMSVESILNTVRCNSRNIKHIVITGGEPLLQAEQLIVLVRGLKELNMHITIESNGTIFNRSLFDLVDLISLSPKLISSMVGRDIDYTSRYQKSIKEVVKSVVDNYSDPSQSDVSKLQFKFVVASRSELSYIDAIFEDLYDRVNSSDILLMPLGGLDSELQQTASEVVEIVVDRGWRFSPRLHVNIWGNRAGV